MDTDINKISDRVKLIVVQLHQTDYIIERQGQRRWRRPQPQPQQKTAAARKNHERSIRSRKLRISCFLWLAAVMAESCCLTSTLGASWALVSCWQTIPSPAYSVTFQSSHGKATWGKICKKKIKRSNNTAKIGRFQTALLCKTLPTTAKKPVLTSLCGVPFNSFATPNLAEFVFHS